MSFVRDWEGRLSGSGAVSETAVSGIDVLGFFTAEHGVGEAARGLVGTLRSIGVPVSTINYTDTESRTGHEYLTDDVSNRSVLLVALNADHIPAAHRIMGREFFADKYVVSQWFWELEQAPHWFEDAYPHVDEIWAPTRFIQEMLQRSAPSRVRVRYMPPVVEPPAIDAALSLGDFRLDERFTFLFSFDYMSIARRKNPVGLVQAFKTAFREEEGPQLVIKSMNGEKRPSDREELENAAGSRGDIILLDKYLTRTETSTLTSLAGCYASLHRSEGLGLTITEALSLGVPVIATGYSGNLDFMDEWNTWRVPATMTRVGPGAGGYPPRAQWAEPDLCAAAAMMREVWLNQAVARRKAVAARDWVLKSFSVQSSAARMSRRLDEIWAELRRG